METISNIASGASKLVFGENKTNDTTVSNETGGQEPISGSQGKGTASDPYDQGNSENPTSTSNNPTSFISTSSDPTTMSTLQVPNNPTNAANAGGSNPHLGTEKTGVTGSTTNEPKGTDIIPSERSENPGAAPSSGSGPAPQKQQGADKPGEEPTGKQADAVKDKKDDGEELLKKRDPNDHSGEPMRMHDGNENSFENRRESKAGQEGGKAHGKEHGTGEQWVKTTGLAADGGDFDVTKPGAGREADRLLEEKGVQRVQPGQPAAPASDDKSSGKEGKEKISVGEKIKNKLHIGHKDKDK